MKSRSAKNKGISIAARKAKGQRLQKDFCKMISELTGYPWGPDTEIESKGSGQHGTDVRLGPNVIKIFPWSLECKNWEKMAIYKIVEQAIANQRDGTDWLVGLKQNNSRPLVVLDAEKFFELLEEKK